jgi:hypothetical protein
MPVEHLYCPTRERETPHVVTRGDSGAILGYECRATGHGGGLVQVVESALVETTDISTRSAA